MSRNIEEIKKDITTLTRVPSLFINEKLKELANEVEEVYQQGRADAIDEFADDMLNKIIFEEKWLFNCKSNNADTNIMISALKTFIKSRTGQLKEQNK